MAIRYMATTTSAVIIPYGLDAHFFHTDDSRKCTLLDVFRFIVCELEKIRPYFDAFTFDVGSSSMTMLQHLKEFEGHVEVSLEVLRNKSRCVNDFGRRVMECLGSYASQRLCYLLCDVVANGCSVDVYRRLIQLQREKKVNWNEVEGIMIARCIGLFESDCDFQDVMSAHDDVSMCIGIVHCFSRNAGIRFLHSCDKCVVSHSSSVQRNNPLLNVCLKFESGSCVYTMIPE